MIGQHHTVCPLCHAYVTTFTVRDGKAWLAAHKKLVHPQQREGAGEAKGTASAEHGWLIDDHEECDRLHSNVVAEAERLQAALDDCMKGPTDFGEQDMSNARGKRLAESREGEEG